jgi:transposase-like protein
MTHHYHNNREANILEPLLSQGLDGLPTVLSTVINEAMKLERERYCGASAYERSDARRTSCNGYKPKQLKSRVGSLSLQVPQTRDSGFYPSFLERGMRSERALLMAVAEMYFQGVSTRRVRQVLEDLCDFNISSSEVSDAASRLDDELEKWRQRQLGCYPYVYLDAMYEKVRYDGAVRDCAVLLAIGVNQEGYRDVIGLSVALSEHERHWRDFLSSLQTRGLYGIQLFISDAHHGLKAAKQAIFPSIPWQRCHFHLAQNAQAYVPRKSQREKAGHLVRSILKAETRQEAKRKLDEAVQSVQSWAPELAQWMEENLPEGWTHFDFPQSHHARIRSSNPLERLNRDIRRRTKKVGVFPNVSSCERLISAILMEQSEEWLTGRRYINFH